MSDKQYYFYYFDEKHDDFANDGIKNHGIPENFVYDRTNRIYRFFKPIVYYAVLGLASCGLALCRVPQKNRRVLKERRDKSKGCFIYGNHTGYFTDAASGPSGLFPRQCYTVVNPDAINVKGLKALIPMLGGIPTPETLKQYREYLRAIEKYYGRGCAIMIYPEAHIWPKYNEIRNFDSVSMYYPVRLGAACYTKTTVFIKKANGKTKPLTVYDGPFYPRTDLSLKDAQDELRDRLRDKMIERTREYGSALDKNYHYIKVNSPDEVRTEIK